MLKLALIGDSGVGKTNITKRIKGFPFQPQYIPTIAFDYQKIDFLINGEAVTVNLWDIGGQKSFYYPRELILQGLDIGIVVYDVRNVNQSDLDKYNYLIKRKNSEKTPIILIGNKVDLITQKNKENVEKNIEMVSEYCDNQDLLHVETSAKNLENFESLESLISQTIEFSSCTC